MQREAGHAGFHGDPGHGVSTDALSTRAVSVAGPPREALTALLNALARAVQAFHTYPAGSPARNDLADAVRERLQACVTALEPVVKIDVTNEGLRIAGELMHGDRGPERALAIALRRIFVATVELRAGVPAREIRQFCALVAFPERLLRRREELPEILNERGVQHLVVKSNSSHETVEVGAVPEDLLELILRERAASRNSPGTDASEGGWIRLDPSVALDRVTLDDLPLLLRDAPSLGVALHQISGYRKGEISPQQALIQHYEEITELYASCDPAVGETLFRRLAGVVRALPEDARDRLLKEEVLPGLLDGHRGGTILGHFSDEEIADALWLLLDLGVGGVEMLSAGFAKLELPESRLPAVADHISRLLDAGGPEGGSGVAELIDGMAAGDPRAGIGERLGVKAERRGDFQAFRSLDLTVDDYATEELDELVGEVRDTDAVTATLRCCADILALSSNPPAVASATRSSRGLFFSLESRGEAAVLADWLARFARIAQERDEHDPEVSAIIRKALAQYVTPEFINRVSALGSEETGELPLVTIICTLGATGVGALIDSLAVEADRRARSRLLNSLQPRARDLAPHLVDYLGHREWFVVRNVLTLLGHAGPGWEDRVLEMVDHEDPRVVHESFRALARIGTPEAAEYTRQALRHPSAPVRVHAGEAVWRYESHLSHPLAIDALGDRELGTLDPALVRSILDGAAKRHVEGVGPVARRLRHHVLAFWNADRRALGLRAIRLSGADT